MNAADYYGLDELRRACAGFVQCCINVDTVCALLASAERYIQYKCTKSLVQKVHITTHTHDPSIVIVLYKFQYTIQGLGICRRAWKRSIELGLFHSTASARSKVDPR